MVFDGLENGSHQGVTSYLTLMEILARPEAEGLPQVALDYEYFLTTFPNLTFYEMGLDVARKASDVRSADRIKAPDAIQLATAILHGATAFLTSDKIFEGMKEIDILILDKFLKPHTS